MVRGSQNTSKLLPHLPFWPNPEKRCVELAARQIPQMNGVKCPPNCFHVKWEEALYHAFATDRKLRNTKQCNCQSLSHILQLPNQGRFGTLLSTVLMTSLHFNQLIRPIHIHILFLIGQLGTMQSQLVRRHVIQGQSLTVTLSVIPKPLLMDFKLLQ